jgi:thiamine biosynthesis lipoprotein
MQRYCFDAMGTSVDCLLEAGPVPETAKAFRAVEREFRRLEALLSRFRPDSELSALNRAGSLHAGPDLVRVTRLALDARERTGGLFDPTVHDALVAAGYDRTFAEVAPAAPPAASTTTPRCAGRVSVDPGTGLIELEPGVRLDLGGIAKGDAVDRACDILGAAGPCLVNAGGDLAVRGRPAAGPWPVGVETGDGEITLGLDGGAIATSGRDRRRWTRGGEERHHVIDPATGRPASTDLLRVTVVAASAAEAEVHAKVLFLAGERGAAARAGASGIPCVVVTCDGRTILGGGLA